MMLIFNIFRYHKFVKSKDLSMKSDTDMDCVFGKRRKKRKRTKSENESDGSGSKEQQKVILWNKTCSNITQWKIEKCNF